MADIETHEYDVIVVGAGGAGLRAAIEASAMGARTALVCKSLLGKAHTVMAEGGIAAAMGNVYSEDNWQVHFRDTMRGGKMMSNWRMAQLHAQEAPERVHELEAWGALFDRTADGRISQRPFGGHRYDRLVHVGDRTGLEMIRTLQQHAVHKGIDVYMECTISRLLKDGDRISGAVGYWRESGEDVVFKAKAIVLATGGTGKAFRINSNSWEYTGDGHSLAYLAGAELIDMEFLQFHPTGMVWPPSVRGILVTEGVRGEGGTLTNSDGKRFMFGYISDYFRAETAETEEEAERWFGDKLNNRRTPDLLPRDEVARAIVAEVKAGRGSPHGGVFLDIASRRSADTTRWAASASSPTLARLRYLGSSPQANAPVACTARTALAETRSQICWCSAAEPAWVQPNTPSGSARNRRLLMPMLPPSPARWTRTSAAMAPRTRTTSSRTCRTRCTLSWALSARAPRSKKRSARSQS